MIAAARPLGKGRRCTRDLITVAPRFDENAISSAFTRPGDWFVLHTRSRQEKALALDLEAHQIPYFLPLRREARYHGNRKCMVDLPLFSSYLFIKGCAEDAYSADRTGRVANILRCPDQQKMNWELRNIGLSLLQNAPLGLYTSVPKGTRVEGRSGPFRGIQGIVEDRTKNNRLILQVEALGRAVAFEIDGSLLDVVE
jgi:transcription termination/antitermination protein NusG